MGPRFDLHVHTKASDGMLTPEETVLQASLAGLMCIAITDHDTTKGVDRAQAEGRKLGIHVMAGAEFSADYKTELHMLGYGMDILSPAYLSFVEEQKVRRKERNEVMLRRLKELGINLPGEYMPGGVSGEYGRKHMALGMVKAGITGSVQQAFDEYLAVGSPAYVKRRKFTAAELIASITEAGGQAVLAHPGRMDSSTAGMEKLVRELAMQGLAGIEAYYPSHTPDQAAFFERLARANGLVCTYGSDWHGYGETGFAQGFDDFNIPDETYTWLDGLLQRAGGFR